MEHRAERHVLNLQGIARLDFGVGAGHDDIADIQPFRRKNIPVFAVAVLQQRNAAVAVRIVLQLRNRCRDIDLVALEVNDSIMTAIAATAMPMQLPDRVVAAARLLQRLNKIFFGVSLVTFA